jgi:hypothetical protein
MANAYPPSPRGGGERVGVRGTLFMGKGRLLLRPLTLALSPKSGERGL